MIEEATMSRYIITPDDIVVRTDTYLVKVETADGQVFEELEPRRLFPTTHPNQYITLLSDKEKEVALIKDLDSLNQASRQAIIDCFSDYYMVPTITKILEVSDRFGMLKWKVLTDRGEIEFSIRNRHSDIKVFGNVNLFVRDSNDNRYISDLNNLDKISLRKIYSYL